MLSFLLLYGICFGEESPGPETFIGLGAQQISYEGSNNNIRSIGAFFQSTIPIMNNLAPYFDLSILGANEPNDSLRDFMEEFPETYDPDVSWNLYRIDLSFGNEIRTRGLIDNFIRLGGELEAEFQPSMYETLSKEEYIAVPDFTAYTRLGLFLDFGTEVPINKDKAQFTLNFGYLFSMYTGGGSLQDESESTPNQTGLEVIIINNKNK